MESRLIELLFLLPLVYTVCSAPVGHYDFDDLSSDDHVIQERFISPSLAFGEISADSFSKIRTKRSEEDECEKLELCKLHARSQSNFLAAFQLYFVNKENARLWDHQGHTVSDCNDLYSCDR